MTMESNKIMRRPIVKGTLKERHACSYCGMVMITPMQAHCGHLFCKKCLDKIMDSDNQECCVDGTHLTREDIFIDNACRREISNLDVLCCNSPQGCAWSGTWNLMVVHLEDCKFVDEKCGDCNEYVQYGTMEVHSSQKCSMRKVECEHCKDVITYGNIKDHLERECLEILRCCPNGCDKDIRMKKDEITKHIAADGGNCPLSILECPFNLIGCTFKNKRGLLEAHVASEKVAHMHMQADAISRTMDSLESNCSKISHMEGMMKAIRVSLEDFAHRVDRDTNKTAALEERFGSLVSFSQEKIDLLTASKCDPTAVNAALEEGASRNAIPSGDILKPDVEKRVATIEKSMDKSSAILTNLTAQVMWMGTTSFDGVLLWRIDQYESRMEEAKSDSITCLMSPPFLTGYHGYRLGAKAYLNGDGQGLNTHISIYIIVMRYRFDNFLSWPFKRSFEIRMINQSGLQDRTVKMVPNASPSFQRPFFEMNMGSGSACFIKHSEVESGGFLRDDSIMIKISVAKDDLPPRH